MPGLSGPPDNASRRHAIGALAALGVATLFGVAGVARAGGARRLVSVGGALTEIVYALQADADLVGVDTTSAYPAAARRLPSVGYARTLSVEGVLALSPTQLIVTEDAGPAAVLRQLGATGLPVSVFAARHRFEGLLDRVRAIAALTGQTGAATGLVQSLQHDWTQARARVARHAAQAPRILFVLAHTPNQIMVAGRDTSAQAMIDYAGGHNAIEGFAGYKPLTPEAVVAARPDLLLATDQGLAACGGAAGMLRLPGIGQTPAGRLQRVVSMDAMYLLGFGPRLPAALTRLDHLLTGAMRA